MHVHTYTNPHKHTHRVIQEKLIQSPQIRWSHEDGEKGRNRGSVALAQILCPVVQVAPKMLWCGTLLSQNSHSACKSLAVAGQLQSLLIHFRAGVELKKQGVIHLRIQCFAQMGRKLFAWIQLPPKSKSSCPLNLMSRATIKLVGINCPCLQGPNVTCRGFERVPKCLSRFCVCFWYFLQAFVEK